MVQYPAPENGWKYNSIGEISFKDGIMKLKTIFILKALIIVAAFWEILPVQAAGNEFQISYSCADCHQERYDEWARSMHALAVSDPIFRAAYTRAVMDEPAYREYCLTCHSPTAIKTKDFNFKKSITLEGVTCSFCHSVTDIKNNSYRFNASNTIIGPYRDSKTDAHESAYSALITKSEFCAGCHEFSMNGIPISETYSEWKEGPYAAEGKECQDCHMEAIKGTAAKDGPERDRVYRHFWYGGHSGQFLEKAFKIESRTQREGSRAKVNISITNSNVGHKIPSGFPSRKVILNFRATDGEGNEIFSDKRAYTKTLLDRYGNEVYDFWKASSIGMDNRIKPKETRTEVFEFDIQDSMDKLNIYATLNYQFEADILTLSKENMNVELAKIEETQLLNETKVDSPITEKSPATGWIGFVVAMITALLVIRRKTSKGGKY